MLLVATNTAGAIEIEQIRWGFNGLILPRHFNLLSILVSNPTPNEIEGTLTLKKLAGGYRAVDAVVKQQYFMSPYASKWIQLYPYCVWDTEEWILSWGPNPNEQTALPQVRSGKPATVILDEPDDSQQTGGRLRKLPVNLFPPTVTATESLDTVFLDHAPRWGEARRRAFLDWLRQGGKVRLLHQANGAFPIFPAKLSILNSAGERTRVGAGRIVRHAMNRGDVDLEFLNSIEMEGTKKRNKSKTQTNTGVLSRTLLEVGTDMHLFNTLRSMTRVKRNWILIYGMGLVYLLLIFPGCYMVAMRKDDYRLVLGSLLATVAVFTTGFFFVGRRDYGETTTIRSVAIARHNDDGAVNVSQWSEAAVTRGDTYKFLHSGSGRLYATGEEFELVKGSITNGVEGNLSVDIPPFSSRTFTHRVKFNGQPIEVSVVDSFVEADALHGLDLQIRKNFPEDAEQIYVLYRDRLYEMKFEGDRLGLSRNVGLIVGLYLKLEWEEIPLGFDPTYDKFQSVQRGFQLLFQPLIARSLALPTRQHVDSYLLPDDSLRLFVYAPMPEQMFALSNAFESQSGYVLHIVELPLQRAR